MGQDWGVAFYNFMKQKCFKTLFKDQHEADKFCFVSFLIKQAC